jgi:hypothetical protein
MDGVFLGPLGLVAVIVAMIVTLYEMHSSLRPPSCPECRHCLEIVAADARQQEQLAREYARRSGLPVDDDDDRKIG